MATTGQYTQGPEAGAHAVGTTGSNVMQDPKRMQEAMSEEYHDPYDDWSSRDLALAFVPFIVAYAFQDVAFRGGLLVALCLAAFQVVMRTVHWDSRRKKVWPVIDLALLFAFAILYGLSFVNFYQVNKWFNVIIPAFLWTITAISLAWRRPWSAHYARYPKFDRGGGLLWHRDATWRRFSDLATSWWLLAFTVMTLLALAPIMTGHHRGGSALNVIFNYITPYLALLSGLIVTTILGNMYRKRTIRDISRYYGYPSSGASGAFEPAGGRAGALGSGASGATETYPAGAQV